MAMTLAATAAIVSTVRPLALVDVVENDADPVDVALRTDTSGLPREMLQRVVADARLTHGKPTSDGRRNWLTKQQAGGYSGMESETRSGVLVPAIGTASSTAAIRSLGRRGVDVIVGSEHETPPGFSSRHCNERIAFPDPTQDLRGYEQALITLAGRPDIDTILPFREADVYALARNRERLATDIGTPWPTLETLRQVQDRVELARAAEHAGVSMPRTDTLGNWEQWESRSIVKPRYTVHAPEYEDDFEKARTEQGSTTYVRPGEQPDRREIETEMNHEPVVQEFVPTTDEYGFFAQYDHGTRVASFQHRQRRSSKYPGSPSAYRESVAIPELEAAGTALLDELDWHGVAMVEFLRSPDTGEFELIEVNPRFWSSLPFTVQAGADFPILYLQQATGRPLSEMTYTPDIGSHLLRGELLYLQSVLSEQSLLAERPSLPGTMREIATSLSREPRFDYLSRSDPGPFLQDVKNTLGNFSGDLLRSRREQSDSEDSTGARSAAQTADQPAILDQ